MDITILCKVVDNFGDIGVVFRLARALDDVKNQFGNINLRIVVDNLKSFAMLVPEIDELKEHQKYRDWEIFQWDSDVC